MATDSWTDDDWGLWDDDDVIPDRLVGCGTLLAFVMIVCALTVIGVNVALWILG